MIYVGYFSDINDKKYKIQIITGDNTESIQEVTLGNSPVVIDLVGGDNIYKECKYSSATIKMISNDYKFDLYSAYAHSNKVEISNNNNIIWVGYLTPNLYNMGYEKIIEEIELEAIDGISTLQYFDYKPLNGTSKETVSFHNLIIHLLNRCECYNNFYFPKSFNDEYIIEKLKISEENFFNEDGDAMTYQEVLEEISKFFGLSCMAIGSDIYFLDYDGIKRNEKTYYKVNLNAGTKTSVNLDIRTKAINGVDYAKNGGQISLDNVYNKVTVKDSLYSFNAIIPSLFDDTVNITSNSDTELSNTDIDSSHDAYCEVLGNDRNHTIAFISKIYSNENLNNYTYKDTCAVAVQYLNNPKFKFYNYDTPKATYNYTDTRSLHGALLAKFFVKKLEKKETEVDSELSKLINQDSTLEKYFASNDITKLEYDNYLVLYNAKHNHINNSQTKNYPYFETGVDNGSLLFGGNNAYILITGSMFFNLHTVYANDDNSLRGKDKFPVPAECIKVHSSESYDYFKKDAFFTLCKLQWGDLFWNGEEWVEDESDFKLYYNKIGGKYFDKYYYDDTIMQEFEIRNNVVFNTGIGEKGYCIKCPENKIMNGVPKFTMYKPSDLKFDTWIEYVSVLFLKDFEVKAVIGDTSYSESNESDTEYFNVIDEDFVNEMETVEFKICTWDNKSPNYSCVGYDGSNGLKFLDTVNRNGKSLRMEEHYIERLVNQYSTPSAILNLNLKNDGITPFTIFTDKFTPNKSYIVDSYSLDLMENKNSIKLTEKK